MKDDQRVVITKKLLREGLLRLLKNKDFGSISVTDLCLESGINRATFYRHYQHPRDIIDEIRYDMSGDMKACALIDEANVNLQEWLEYMCRYFYERADLLNILFRCRTDEEFVSLINELYYERVENLQKAGIGAEFDEDEFRLAMYYCSGGIYYVLRQWITEPMDKTPQEVARVIYKFLEFYRP